MTDDGLNGDGAAGDGVYGITLLPMPVNTHVDYFVAAMDDSGTSVADPPSAPVDLYSFDVRYAFPPIVINEFMAINETTLQDEMGDFDPWMEILNAGEASYSLEGTYLSDDLQNTTKFALPDTVIPEGGYVLIWCDNEPGEGSFHTNFTLEANGGSVAFFEPVDDGNNVVDSADYGPQMPGVSFGRYPNGTGALVFMGSVTPGAENDPPYNLAPHVSETGHSPESPLDIQQVSITSRIVDDSGIGEARLFYDTGNGFISVPMLDDGAPGDGFWGAVISPVSGHKTIKYYVSATDDSGSVTTDPPAAPAEFYTYTTRFTRAINSGGNNFASQSGLIYLTDQPYSAQSGFGYVAGNAQDTWQPVGGADSDSSLYPKLRASFGQYLFDVPNGSYLVRLRFLEHARHGPNERRFRISLEGVTAIDTLDIFAEVGRAFALDYQASATVSDGQLVVQGNSLIRAPIISGIAVVERAPDAIAPGKPQSFTALDGYREVNLDWAPPADDDLRGFRIYRATDIAGPYQQVNTRINLVSRRIDRNLDPSLTYFYYLTAEDVWGNTSPPTDTVSVSPKDPEADSELPVYELTVNPADILLMNQDITVNIYVPLTFSHDGTTWNDAEIRYKGSFVRTLAKKSYKLRFNETHLFQGHERWHLNAEMPDASLMRNHLSLLVHRIAGTPSATSRYILPYLNGRFLGLCHELEDYDQYYLDARPYLDNDANLYKAEDGANLTYLPAIEDYEIYYDKRTNETQNDWTDLQQLTAAIDLSSEEDLYDELVAIMDLDGVATYLATQVILQNVNHFDHNYFLYNDSDRNQWRVLPWDADFAWGYTDQFTLAFSHTRPVNDGIEESRLVNRFFNNEFLRRKWLDTMLWLLETDLSVTTLDSLIQATHQKIQDAGVRDWYKWPWEKSAPFLTQPAKMMTWVHNRDAFLRTQYNLYHTDPVLLITEFMADNDTTLADEFGDFDDWLEIYNPGQDPVSLQGFFLTEDLTWTTKWALPASATIAPKDYLLIWMDGEPWEGPFHATIQLDKLGESVGLFKFDPLEGSVQPVDAFAFGPQQTDVSYARINDADVCWIFEADPTPGTPNGETTSTPEDARDPFAGRWLGIAGAHPFHNQGALRLELPSPARVVVTLHDVGGRRIRTLYDGEAEKGTRRIVWDGRDDSGHPVASGVYWAALRSPGREETLKLVILKR
jgi:spore coat protein H